jgi:hypothetical protein
LIKKIFLIAIFPLLVACNGKEQDIKKILHQGDYAWWGIYDAKNKSKERSYKFQVIDNLCLKYNENKFFGFLKIGAPEQLADFTWNVEINRIKNISYLRCGLDAYVILNYNERYFKLLTKDEDTIYLYRSPECQSSDCFIPKQMPPAPW